MTRHERISIADLTLAEGQHLLNALAEYRRNGGEDMPEAYEGPEVWKVAAPDEENEAVTLNPDQAGYFEAVSQAQHMQSIAAAPAPLPTPVAQPADDRDAFGVPWHPEIHSSSRQKNDKGAWRLRRGIDKEKARIYVEQHLGDASTVAPTAAQLNVQHGAPAWPQPTPVVTPAVLPMPAAQPTGISYPEWYARFDRVLKAGRITVELQKQMYEASGAISMEAYATHQGARDLSYMWLAALDPGIA